MAKYLNNRVKDLKVGVAGKTDSENVLEVSGNVVATKFTGDGSGLTAVIADQAGIKLENDGSLVGTATTVNFSTGIEVSTVSSGFATVTVTSAGSGSGLFVSNDTGIHTTSNVGIGTTTADGAADPNNTTILNVGIVTANYFYGDGSGLDNISGGIRTDTQNNHYGTDLNASSFNGSATDNVLLGNAAGDSITSGSNNVIIGSSAGDSLTTGDGNTAVGYKAGEQIGNSSVNNVFIGKESGLHVDGNANVAIGKGAIGGSNATGGSSNVCIGPDAGNKLTGTAIDGNGRNNLMGSETGKNITTGDENTFIGHAAGVNVGTGKSNTFIGARSGGNFTGASDSYNIAIGRSSATNVIEGSDNTIIGSHAFPGSTTLNGQISIGAGTTELIRANDTGIGIGTDIPDSAAASDNTTILNVGIVTANYFYGNISRAEGLPAQGISDISADTTPSLGGNLNAAGYNITNAGIITGNNLSISGISTFLGNVGIGTTNAASDSVADTNNTTILNAGIVTANYFYGNGSGLTGLAGAQFDAVSQDTNPSLGGNLNAAGYNITNVGIITGDNFIISGISSIGTGITFYASSGIISATKFYGDISEAEGSGISDISADTTPSLGGDLDGGTYSIYNVGIATASSFNGELHTTSLLKEEVNSTSGKLSDNTNIDIANGMVHYFTTTETTTSTPNIRYDASNSLNSKMSNDETVSVNIITTSAIAGYSTAINIDGTYQQVKWNGGVIPYVGNSDGNDIYSFQILKTADSTFQVYGSLTNLTSNPNNNPRQFTVGDEGATSVCFPVFTTAATGTQAPKTDASSLTYNSTTGQLSSTSFKGDGSSLAIGRWNVSDDGANTHYQFTGSGGLSSSNDPTLYLARGQTYEFNMNASGHPFYIQTSSGAYNASNLYTTGVTNAGAAVGVVTFAVPFSAPNTLYYVCQNHSNMAGTITVFPTV